MAEHTPGPAPGATESTKQAAFSDLVREWAVVLTVDNQQKTDMFTKFQNCQPCQT